MNKLCKERSKGYIFLYYKWKGGIYEDYFKIEDKVNIKLSICIEMCGFGLLVGL